MFGDTKPINYSAIAAIFFLIKASNKYETITRTYT
jgi:hypothetical protein